MKNMARDIGAWRAERPAARAAIRQALAPPTIASAAPASAAHTHVHTVHGRAAARVAEAAEALIDIAEHQQHLRASLQHGAAACERAYCLAIEALETLRDVAAAQPAMAFTVQAGHTEEILLDGSLQCQMADINGSRMKHAVRSLEGLDVAAACTALEGVRDAELAALDTAYAAKARRLQQDRAAVEARVAEWVAVAEHMAALLADGDPPSADAALPPAKRHKGLQDEDVQRACAEALAALAQTWRLQCGHAGAPWLRVSSNAV